MSCVAIATIAAGQGRYLETQEFLAATFAEGRPEARTLWITEELRGPIEQLLGHPFPLLRVRYWLSGAKTAWILDEVGKEELITIGVTVRDSALETVRVLEFRESRGWEVRYAFFTDQFTGGRLDLANNLDRHVDGITGATLSVHAVTRVARLALFLDAHVQEQ